MKLCSNKEKDWDEYLDPMLLAYRIMKSRITGFSPFQLVYGRKAKLPIEVIIETQNGEYMTEEHR